MFEQISKYLSQELDIPLDEITTETTLDSLGMDSLDKADMVMNLEETLNISLEGGEEIATIGELVSFVESKL